MSIKEMYLLKEEIYVKIKELETKFFNEITKKNSEINFNLNIFDEKVNSILNSNKEMIDSVTNQKMNFDKLNELESKTGSMDEDIITHKIQIKNILSEINRLRIKYDKIISDNIYIPGYVGPGTEFVNLGELIINLYVDVKKIKEEKDKIKKESKELKSKLDTMLKNLASIVENNSTRIREYAISKDREIEKMLDNKFKKYEEKSSETNQNLLKAQNKLEEKLRQISYELGKFTNEQSDISILNNRIEEINKKEEEISNNLYYALLEVKEVKKIKKDLSEQIKIINIKLEDIKKNRNRKIENKTIDDKMLNSNLKPNKSNTNLKSKNNKKNIKNRNKNNDNFFISNTNIKNFETNIKNNLPNLNSQNKTFFPNNFINKMYNKDESKTTLSFNKDPKQEFNKKMELKFNENLDSDKKLFLNENKNIVTAPNLKVRDISNNIKSDLEVNVNLNLEKEIKKNSYLLNNKMNIKENIFQKTINNFRIDKNESKNERNKIISYSGLKNFLKSNDNNSNEPNLRMSIDYIKKNSEKMVSISEYANLKKSNINQKKLFNSDLMQRNMQTYPPKNFNTVDCNLVNLNKIDVPNINDNNINDNSNNDIFYNSFPKRKINSVNESRSVKTKDLVIKTNRTFNSSKNIKNKYKNIFSGIF